LKTFKPVMMLAIVMAMLLTLGHSVYAFKDIKDDPNEQQITSLKDRGIINGNAKGKYNPSGKLTYAEGVTLIVKAFELNIDHMRFIKEPLATDYYPKLKNNEWYSQSFIIAHLNGLDIPQNVKATDKMTREQYAHSLFKAITKKGEYAFIDLYKTFKDEDKVSTGYMDSIQKLLISEIASLDKKDFFKPNEPITRSDAAGWLFNAVKFVKDTPTIPEPEPVPNLIYNPELTVSSVNADINKVTITAQVPHPGYGIKVSAVSFEDEQALIHLEIIEPDPDRVYPQVISNAQAITYIDSKYKPVLADKYMHDETLLQTSIAQ